MRVTPEYKSLGELFNRSNIFRTPRYQRDYSWGPEQIDQFCNDISNAIRQKSTGNSYEHFFGGVVCAQIESVGDRIIENTLVDGQQRLSTIVLFFSILKRAINNIDASKIDEDYKSGLIDDIENYLTCKERINRESKVHKRLAIGIADDEYFQALVDGHPIEAKRDSHKLMLEACKSITSFIGNTILNSADPLEQLDSIDTIVSLFKESFLIIHIITTSVDDAYKLFMVLNDRGINLTEGELLKAHTLGIHDEKKPIVRKMAREWDEILQYKASSVSNYLRWSLIMLCGEHVAAINVLDTFKKLYFEDGMSLEITAERVTKLCECVKKLSLLEKAEWPYENTGNNISTWHKIKLEWLIDKLKHTHAMPVILAASFAKEELFKNTINEICRFFIRYKIISNLHVGIFSSLYSELAAEIYRNPTTFRLATLHNKFSEIISRTDPNDIHFKAGIRSLQYKRKGDNKPIKYLFIYIDESWRWLTDGAKGGPKNRLAKQNYTKVFDFNNTTIEHLYPYSAKENDSDSALEEVKNSIGNLVLLDPKTNQSNADTTFLLKKNKFDPQRSDVGMHSLVFDHDSWTADDVEKMTSIYIDFSLKVFSF